LFVTNGPDPFCVSKAKPATLPGTDGGNGLSFVSITYTSVPVLPVGIVTPLALFLSVSTKSARAVETIVVSAVNAKHAMQTRRNPIAASCLGQRDAKKAAGAIIPNRTQARSPQRFVNF
jgi:hypothetical protein